MRVRPRCFRERVRRGGACPSRVGGGARRSGQATPGRYREPPHADRRRGGCDLTRTSAERQRDAAVRGGGRDRDRRAHAHALPLRRHPTSRGACRPRAARSRDPALPQGTRKPRVHGGRDTGAHEVDTGRRSRLRGAEQAESRQVLRSAAVSPAVQATPHGRRHRALLPDRALLSGRGPQSRPSAGVHSGRHRDVLRHPRRCPLDDGRGHARGRRRGRRRTGCPSAQVDLRRGHGAIRLGQARHAIRHGARRRLRCLLRERLQGLCRRAVGWWGDQGNQRQGRRGLESRAHRRPQSAGAGLRSERACLGGARRGRGRPIADREVLHRRRDDRAAGCPRRRTG